MPINPDAVGAVSDPAEHTWTSKDCLLYALGVGAGTDDLAFTTENSIDIDQQVLPTMPVVLNSAGSGSVFSKLGDFNPAMLVHGEQSVELHRPIPVSGTLTATTEITGIYDKGKAAVVVMESSALSNGEPIYTTTSSLFIRGEGGWGGDRGPSGPRNVPPERDADEIVTYNTSRDQAFVYRLSGDRNPLHTDPSFAAMGGFDTPILHGLCTYGFTGRALLHTLCDGDPGKFGHVEGRFASPVFPGEALTVRMWSVRGGETVFTTSAGDAGAERVVIDQGLLRHG
ncbi:MAG: MaoC/PaaZ C-terminal domain-containing protein [Acidimicrobiia bacterium]|nr:MaoC/PaaZ C-terminal domain-containing protein [Acidimicrobiia bacterium]